MTQLTVHTDAKYSKLFKNSKLLDFKLTSHYEIEIANFSSKFMCRNFDLHQCAVGCNANGFEACTVLLTLYKYNFLGTLTIATNQSFVGNCGAWSMTQLHKRKEINKISTL